MNKENINNIPNRVHFDRGFGYKYQYLLATLIIKLINDNENITKDNKFKKELVDDLLHKVDTNDWTTAVESTLKNILHIVEFNKAKYNENILLMMEGDNKFFEDINIFNNINKNNKILFLQVKGKDSNSRNNNNIIMKAMHNFLKNKNIENIDNFTFIVMTNKNITSHFYNKDINDSIKLSNSFIKELEEVKVIKKYKVKNKIQILLCKEIKNKLKLKTYFTDNSDFNKIDKRTSFYKNLGNNFYKELNKIILVLQNLKVIDFIDHKVIIHILNEICDENEFFNVLWKIEMLSMNRKDLTEKDLKDIIKSINFDKKIIDKIRFSDKEDIKYGKIFN